MKQPNKNADDAEPEPKTEEKVEVAVVDQNGKEIGKNVEGEVKESENKVELIIDQKAAIEADPAFATQEEERKAESTREIEKKVEADIKAKEVEK